MKPFAAVTIIRLRVDFIRFAHAQMPYMRIAVKNIGFASHSLSLAGRTNKVDQRLYTEEINKLPLVY